MKYEQLSKDIIQNVGGKENVISVVHCITRLRFKLRDESKANTEVLKDMDGIVTVMKSGGQYQVVIGNHVPDVFKEIVELGGFQTAATEEEEDNSNQSIFNKLIDIIASIFTPVLGVLAATGMIKGFNALFLALGWLEDTSGTYQILNAVGDSLFYFFPIFLGYTAIKKFGGSPFIGMAIGGSLVYPDITALSAGEPLYTLFAGSALFEAPIFVEFLGIPVILMTYSSSVIPIILAAFFASRVEGFLKKLIPDVVKVFVVPFLTLIIVVPITFMVIGPIATWAANLIGMATNGIYDLSPIIAGAFIGAFWQVLVIFGLHWGLIPIAINNLTTLGSDPILAMMFTASFAQTGAVIGVLMKTKNKKIKTLSIPAAISGIFGVTEPAIYGVTLPLKRPFIISCIVAGLGGAVLGIAGTRGYMIGGLGIFGIPSYISPEGMDAGFWGMIIAMIGALVLGIVLTYLFGVKNEKTSEQTVKEETTTPATDKVVVEEKAINGEVIASPLAGEVRQLSEIKDESFASGAMGKGVAIEPIEGKLFSPVTGTITALFPTKHALGITTEDGAEILIHVGMDTVNLGGQYFTSYVKQGDIVEKGKLLVEFDLVEIKKAGYLVTTPVIVTNPDNYAVISFTEQHIVKPTETLITLKNENSGN
ncbi:beta-glucoside-specific PTS transporter subunit IIABC [Paraliobacillus zengyii]|uniref:beta-glucoside-specific PTS transporter subunit IIABC n=1 Tax=Paraliobacillus zengyii TaxID=2213194 RepID=UPI000DD3CDCD|nr:beta-glucoside-specific PTS transporter subunit IIABC [Paraliobacillus zengyii]